MEKLHYEALVSCLNRGHAMADWEVLTDHSEASRCWKCGMEVVCDTKPMPNGIDIGGEAVALNCEGER